MSRKVIVCVLVSAALFWSRPSATRAQNLEVLLANLKSPVVGTRRDAAKKLGENRSIGASEALAAVATKDSDAKVRENALWALGQIRDFKQVPVMIDGLADNLEDVRRAALMALVSLYKEDGTGFILNRRRGINIVNPFLDTNDRAMIDPSVEVDDRITTALAKVALTDRSETMRTGAVRALGVLRGEAAVPELVKAMQQDRTVRIDVLKTFIKFGNTDNGKYAVPYFNATDRDVREQAIAAAGELHSKEAIPELLAQYNNNPEWRKASLHALAQIPAKEAEGIFVQNLRHEDEERQQYANEGLARIGADKYTEEVSKLRLTEKKNRVLLAQAFALYKFGRKEYLLYIVEKSDSGALDDQAESYLREVSDPSDLYAYLNQGTTKRRGKVAEALGYAGTSETIPKLEDQLKWAKDSDYLNALNLAVSRIKRREATGGRPRRTVAEKKGTKAKAPPPKKGRQRRVEP